MTWKAHMSIFALAAPTEALATVFARRCALLGVLVMFACGSSNGGASFMAGDDGTVKPPWTQYCVATFTKPHEVIDSFGDLLFAAQAGDAYLLMDYGEFFGEDRAALGFLTEFGPSEFELTAPLSSRDFPFTTDCAFGTSTPYYAVFADVVVFDDESLMTELCTLTAGTVIPAAGGQRGYVLAGDLQWAGPLTYEVSLDGFSEQCGGSASGFISAPEVQVLGASTNLVPIQSIIGPE